MELDEYTLWLEPAGKNASILQNYIENFASRAGTHSFPPHLTLIGGISSETPDIQKIVRSLAESRQPFIVSNTVPDSSDQFYKSVFIQYVSEELITFNKEAQRVFSKSYEYEPHVSLLYGKVSSVLAETFVSELQKEPLILDFEVRRMSLWHAKGEYTEWKKLETFPLG